MRPIDADSFVSVLQLVADSLRGGDCGEWLRGYVDGLDAVHRALMGVDTITLDDLGVVRCKDCKYWQDNNEGYPHPECRWGHGETPDPDDYCSFGAKMGGGK